MTQKPASQNNSTFSPDVCIIGAGFAGMNAARLLAKQGISCAIYSSESGASNLWSGSFDVLNYPGDNLALELAKFQVALPAHPYQKQNLDSIHNSLEDFFSVFSRLHAFKNEEEGLFINHPILTPFGNMKLCAGVWDTIFHQFDSLTPESTCILVEFQEFPDSTMHLIAKGLQEKFSSRFLVLTLSLQEFFQRTNEDLIEDLKNQKLSTTKLASFFDEKTIHMSSLANYIKEILPKQHDSIDLDEISYYFFPPILGVDKTQTILTNLESYLGAECRELILFSPSIMSARLYQQFSRKLKILSVPVQKGYILKEITRSEDSWLCTIQNEGVIHQIKSKFLILATGSIFLDGIMSDLPQLGTRFTQLGLEYPNSIGRHLEVRSTGAHSRIFVIGTASFLFSTDLSFGDEVHDGSGLGLAISTSYTAVQAILGQISSESNPTSN